MLPYLSFPHWLVVISVLISLFRASIYVRDTLTGKTKPNRISHAMWALAPAVGVISALSAHADIWTTSRIFMAGFGPFVILLASFFNRQSYWKLTPFDFLCGLFSAFGLVALLFAKSPELAILFAVIGDCFAAIPTIIKSWKYPGTETGLSYIAGLIAALLIVPSIPKWDITNSAFQIYLIVVEIIFISAIYRKQISRWFSTN
ncbi:MAG: hypothetical protein V4467_04275 [Patescibacteria group bacterium]